MWRPASLMVFLPQPHRFPCHDGLLAGFEAFLPGPIFHCVLDIQEASDLLRLSSSPFLWACPVSCADARSVSLTSGRSQDGTPLHTQCLLIYWSRLTQLGFYFSGLCVIFYLVTYSWNFYQEHSNSGFSQDAWGHPLSCNQSPDYCGDLGK